MAPPNKRIRRRVGARAYKNYSEDMLQLAVELVKNKQTTSYDAEKQFGIPRRTIEKRVKNLHSNKPGPRFRLSDEEESKFIKVLIAAGDFGCPLSMLDFKLMVWDYLKKNNKTYIFNDKLPGDWWAKNFLCRHKDRLTLRSTQNITRARAEKTLQEFEEYFQNLEISLQNVPSTHILNYDETNVSDDPGSAKSIFRRGIKYPERIVNHSKGCISLMFAATADGNLLPPYVVYKAENLWSEWCKDGPTGACYNRSKSGWFDSVVFLDWFSNIVIPWASQLEGEKLVIGDNLSSHLNIEVVELCDRYKIRFVFLPSRSTQLTQPLDVAFFAPLKKAWRNILLKYKIENPKQASLNKSHFPLLLKQLMDEINVKKQNIISGFRATGIYPFNPYEVYKKIPEYEHEIKYDVDETLLNYLKENKQPNPLTRRKNSKLNVAPGRSVKSSDIAKLCKKNSGTVKTSTTTKTTTYRISSTCKDITEVERENKEQQCKKYTTITTGRKRKPLKKQKHSNDSSDSNSSCTVSACDTSEYDPMDDKDSLSDTEEITERVLISTKSEKIAENSKVTILSEIKNTAENKSYFDLSKYGPFSLKPINKYSNFVLSPKAKLQDKKSATMEGSLSQNNEPTASSSYEPEKINSVSYNVNEHVLVRFVLQKKVKYFVGRVLANISNKYQVSFYKCLGKNDNIRFIVPKISDVDIVEDKMIVKSVQLMAINEKETEFIFYDDDDLVYFD